MGREGLILYLYLSVNYDSLMPLCAPSMKQYRTAITISSAIVFVVHRYLTEMFQKKYITDEEIEKQKGLEKVEKGSQLSLKLH